MAEGKKDAPGKSPAEGGASAAPLVTMDAAIASGVTVRLSARLGAVSMPLKTLFALKAGEVVALDTQVNDLIEIYLQDALVGRGEIVAVGDNFGVRIVEIAAP